MQSLQYFFAFFLISEILGLAALSLRRAKTVLDAERLLIEVPLVGFSVFQGLVIAALLFHEFPLTYFTSAGGLALAVALWNRKKLTLATDIFRVNFSFAFFVGVFLLGALLREGVCYFIYSTGDMGEYVNRANMLARGVELKESFPHLFTAMLATSNVLFGMDHTVALIPFLGLMSSIAVVGIARHLGLNRNACLFIFAAVNLGLFPSWFSKFPVSETLYGLQLVSFYFFLVLALKREDLSAAGLAGLQFLFLGLTRGNSLLLAVVVSVVGLLLVAQAKGRRATIYFVAFTMVMLSFFLAYLYNITHVYNYYVSTQLANALGSAFQPLAKFGMFEFGPWLVMAMLLPFIVLYLSYWMSSRQTFPSWEPLRPRLEKVVRIGSLVLCFSFLGICNANFSLGTHYFSPLVTAMAVVGLILFFFRPRLFESWKNDLIILVLLVTLVFSAFFCHSNPKPENHAYYLYWFRYLYSEVYWGFLVFAAIAAHTLFAQLHEKRWNKVLVPALLFLSVGCFLYQSAFIANRAQFAGSYEQVRDLAEHMVDRERPVFFSGGVRENASMPEGWFFPNLWRAYGDPLEKSFDFRMVNLSGNLPAFGPDAVASLEEIVSYLRQQQLQRAYLVMVNGPRGRPSLENLWNEAQGSRDHLKWEERWRDIKSIPLLPGRTNPKNEKWLDLVIQTAVYELELVETPVQ